MQTTVEYQVCVVSNDAEKGDGRYQAAGPNMRWRLLEAIQWSKEELPPDAHVEWSFGAGTDAEHANGPTLAEVNLQALQEFLPEARKGWVNTSDKTYYGTLEEIWWIVEAVANARAQLPERHARPVQFVFFTQAAHLPRVKLIWRLFFARQWGQAIFVETGQREGHELSRLRERWARQKVRLIWLRYQLPDQLRWLIPVRPRFEQRYYE